MKTPRHAPREVHRHELVVRYAETDQMRRVHHAAFLIYLEEARTRMMADVGCSYSELERRGFGLAVRTAELRYRGAAFYEDVLVVETFIAELRGASVTLGYRVLRGDELLLTASTQLACIDLRLEPPEVKQLPDDVRAAFVAAGGSET